MRGPQITKSSRIQLSPAQQKSRDAVAASLRYGNLIVLSSKTGRGRTTVLESLNRELGGSFVSIKDFVTVARQRHPLSLEDSVYEWLINPLQDRDLVFVDDLHLATAVMSQCHFYPRSGLLNATLTAVAAFALAAGKRIVLGNAGSCPDPIDQRSIALSISSFNVEDYEHLCELFLGERVSKTTELDFDKVFRFAPKLNAHQLKAACIWLKYQEDRTTHSFIDYLRSRRLTSNVELGEVAEVSLSDLKGVDDVIKSLEANIVLPLEKEDLADKLGLASKRGVLLAGPPGTGKTTVGRALAHRLRGKFFLIDGTFISGTRQFYDRVHRVFHAAMDNAPSVIFIDDSDVIFESGEEHGLYRYLLTMLDGLESKSAGRVCVMMTAMNVGNLPAALVRSGRIELWLEMQLPDEAARRDIFRNRLSLLPETLGEANIDQIISAMDGFTGADIGRTIDDAKALYAFDLAYEDTTRPLTEYFLGAVDCVRKSKEKYSAAERHARRQRSARPPWFDVGMDDFDTEDE